ncbi:EF-hand calcium-binding domain-containing protein 13 [Orycteropus afer afer]|uniref:EF-hand calcium-binding domain-containing protein 13 n=1 Tax=Orycteropus afer afer TaxID=1230840 RepID=A0A8B7BD73_ORYAF|nr:EF-hand calcium-binding domain-containing protein 13 [Orycteropus afer afer]
METKVQLFCQAEENTELVDAGSHSSAADSPSRHFYSKKYIKFSKTTEKKISPLISPEIRDLSSEHKKRYETSVFVCEEKCADKVKRKQSLQVQLLSKRSEITSSSAKLSKEKITKKESSVCKLPNQYRVPKTSSPIRTPSSGTREKKTFSNLYQTLYDEVPHGRLYSEELSALHKACKVFSKIRNGKISVNDLSTILHTLKISMSDSEMRQTLKTIDIDPFQDALKIFCRIKDGQVAVDEVIPVLNSMDVFVAPETVQEVISYTYVDSKNMVDIGNIIFILEELQQQYEDVSITEGPDLDETTSNQKLSKPSQHSLQFKNIDSLSSRLPETPVTQKFSRRSLQYHSKIMENNDNLEFKSSKYPWEMKRIPDGVDNSDGGSQEPYSKNGINLKKPSDKAEINDLKSKPQSLKSISSFKKSLDKSNISSIPKLKQPAVRRRSSLLKQISSKEKTAIDTQGLKNVYDAVRKLKENYIAAEELRSILPSVGITLSDKEFQKIVTDISRNENEMVKLDDFISALTKERSSPKCAVLSDVIKAIDKIKDNSVDYEDLSTCLQNFGVYLSKPEFEKIKDLTEVDEMKKVNFKEFVDNMMKNTERFSEKLLLPDAIENLNNLNKEKIHVSDLWDFLSSLNSNLKNDEFLDALKLATADEDDKVQFAEMIKNMYDASRLDELKEVVFALNLLEGDMVAGKNLEDFQIKEAARVLTCVDNGRVSIPNLEYALKNLNINLTEEELNEALKSCGINENMEVDLKEFLMGMKEIPSFKKSIDDVVNFKDFIRELTNADEFIECQRFDYITVKVFCSMKDSDIVDM